jgi:hypothetical protein
VRRVLLAIHVFLMMCLPIPQAAYAAVGLGRTVGLGMLHLISLYVASDLVAYAMIVWVARRYGRRGLEKLAMRLPGHARGPLLSALDSKRVSLPAMFVTGYANLYLAALIAGLSRRRVVPAAVLGIGGDVIQFTSTVLLAGVINRLLPIPGGEWAVLLTLPLLLGVLPIGFGALKKVLEHVHGLRPVLQPAPVPVPVRADERHPR